MGMNSPGRTGQGPVAVTAGHVAIAIVAACRLTGRPPEQVFEKARGNKRARALAAAGCMAALNLTPKAAGRLFHIQSNRLAPSMLRHDGIEAGDVLKVVEALTGPPPRPTAATAPMSPSHKPAPPSPNAEPPVAAGPVADAPPTKPQSRKPAPRSQPTPAPRKANPVRAASRGVERLKSVSDNMVRWSRIYVARGMAVEDLADLFDVDPEALASRLKPELARAA